MLCSYYIYCKLLWGHWSRKSVYVEIILFECIIPATYIENSELHSLSGRIVAWRKQKWGMPIGQNQFSNACKSVPSELVVFLRAEHVPIQPLSFCHQGRTCLKKNKFSPLYHVFVWIHLAERLSLQLWGMSPMSYMSVEIMPSELCSEDSQRISQVWVSYKT